MDYSYSYDAGGAGAVFFTLIWLVFAVLTVVGLWKTLSKAGLPGWAAIIPFYNGYNIVKMSNRPTWFFWAMLGCALFSWIPLLGFLLGIGILVLWIFVALDIAANFGQGTGFAILLIIFPWIMFLILGFGSAQFHRIAAPGSAGFGSPPMPASGTYTAVPPAPPAGGYAAAPAPPAPPAPPAQTSAPTAPVTPPATPTEAAPAAPVTPTEAAPATPVTPTDTAPAAPVTSPDTAATPETKDAPTTPPEAPSAPSAPSASSPPAPPPLT